MMRRCSVKLKKERIRPISEEDPLTLFHGANRSPRTDEKYTYALRWLLCDVMEEVLQGTTFEERAKEFVKIGRNEPDEMMGILLGLSGLMRDRTEKDKKSAGYLNPSTIPTYFSSLRKLLNTNDVSVHWRHVTNSFPELDNVIKTQGWTREEICLMLDHAKDTRDRALILTLASSGVRCEGLLLRWGDLTRTYDVGGKMVTEKGPGERVSGEPACVAVNVYRGTTAEYVTFITPEAYRAIMDYAVEWEADAGKEPGDDDPIFRQKIKLLNGLAAKSIYGIIQKTALSAGVWMKHPDNPRLGKTPLLNGFRRFFNKTLKDTISPESPASVLTKAEFMMGHKGLLPLDANYYKTSLQELAGIYVNAIPYLTISESERSRQADRHGDAATLGLSKQDGRIRQLDDMSQAECLELLEEMLAYHRRKFAGSTNPT